MTKILKNENAFLNVRLIFIIVVLLYAVVRQNITLFQPHLMSGIWNILITLGAGAIFLWDIVFFRNVLKTNHIWALAGLFVLTGVSVLLNYRYAFADNIKATANMFIQFFVLYAVGNRLTKQRIHRDVTALGSALGVVWLVAVVISLFMFFFDINYNQTQTLWGIESSIPQGFVRTHQGVTVMRLWGVFIDPNFAAAVSIIVICFCVYMLSKTQKRWVRALYITNIVSQLLYVVLSGSRMAALILLFLVFVGFWYISILKFKKSKFKIFAQKRLMREFAAVVLSVVMVAVCYFGIVLAKKALPYMQYGISYMTGGLSDNGSGGTSDSDDEIISLERLDVDADTDISNGRLKLWKQSSDVIEKSPFIGVGPRSYHEIAKEMEAMTGAKISIARLSVHNSYIELLMGNGVAGFLLLLVFFVLCAKDAIVLRFKNSKSLLTVGILMLTVLGTLAGGMFISSLFYYLSAISIVSFAMLGYAVAYMQCEKEENFK